MIYSQNIDQTLGASNAQFILAPYNSMQIEIAKALPISQGVYVTDMEILDDTLFFCGYRIHDSAGYQPQTGLIGYFSIPDMFGGNDDFHILQFNQYPMPSSALITTDPPATAPISSYYIKYPSKMEVFKTDSGMHVVCVGLWGRNHNKGTYRDYFIADIVHKFNTNHWWYYVSMGNLTEAYSDIAVTDNYIATIAPKFQPNSRIGVSECFGDSMLDSFCADLQVRSRNTYQAFNINAVTPNPSVYSQPTQTVCE